MAKTRKWMPLFIGDYLADTAHLNAAQSGAYLHLIMHYWQHGGLPDDDRRLAVIAKLSPYQWEKFSPVLRKFFRAGWRHKRIDFELQRADEVSEKRSRAGVIGNATRSAMRSQNPRNATHTYTRSTSTETLTARSKKDASRGSKEGNGIEPSAELVELERSRGHKP